MSHGNSPHCSNLTTLAIQGCMPGADQRENRIHQMPAMRRWRASAHPDPLLNRLLCLDFRIFTAPGSKSIETSMRTAYLCVSMKFDLFHDLFFQGSAWIAKSVVFSTQFWCLHKTGTCQNTCQHAANCTIMTETPNWKTINHLNISHASIWDLLKWTLGCHPQKLKHLLINLFFWLDDSKSLLGKWLEINNDSTNISWTKTGLLTVPACCFSFLVAVEKPRFGTTRTCTTFRALSDHSGFMATLKLTGLIPIPKKIMGELLKSRHVSHTCFF